MFSSYVISCSLVAIVAISVLVTVVSCCQVVMILGGCTTLNCYVTRYSTRFDCGTTMPSLLSFLDASKKCHSLFLFTNFEIHCSHLHPFFVSTRVDVVLLHSCICLEHGNHFLCNRRHAITSFHDSCRCQRNASAPLGFQISQASSLFSCQWVEKFYCLVQVHCCLLFSFWHFPYCSC
jgi:hypothetical protein